MTAGDTIEQATTMWGLVERRAAASPDVVPSSTATTATSPSPQFRDRAERVAAGLSRARHRHGTPVTWQLPTRIETVVLSLALARLGAVQNPILHLYRDARSASRCAQTERGSCSCRACGAASTSRRWRER